MRSKSAMLNIITNILLQFIVILYGFIVPKIIISTFGSNVNGLISSITQFLAYISLLESGFGPVVRAALYKPIAKKDVKTICSILKTAESFFRKIAIIFLLYILILCCLYPMLVSNDFGWLYTSSLIIIIGISTFAEYFFGMTYKLYLHSEQKLYIISIVQIITYILSIIIVILLSIIGANIHVIKLSSGIIFVLRPLLQCYYVKKKFDINLKNEKNSYKLEQKWDGFAQHIAAVIHGNTDITLLTIFTNLAEVSVYSVYYMVVKGLKSLIQSLTSGVDASFGDMIAKSEHDNLNKKFDMYEVLYNAICTILFTCAIVLIVPFVSIYTKGINDANYTRYVFGVLIVISEYIWAIRLPFSSITLSAGHFKETKKGAWIECITNIVVSVILVSKFGLIGVTIGTIIAMSIRTCEFIYHSNKYILNRSIFKSISKILLLIIETVLIVYICKYIPFVKYNNYFNWIINSLMVFGVSSIVTFIMNYLIFKKQLLESLKLITKIIKKEKNKAK